MFHDNAVIISENLNKINLLKTYLKFTYPTDFFLLYRNFYYGKKIFDFSSTNH